MQAQIGFLKFKTTPESKSSSRHKSKIQFKNNIGVTRNLVTFFETIYRYHYRKHPHTVQRWKTAKIYKITIRYIIVDWPRLKYFCSNFEKTELNKHLPNWQSQTITGLITQTQNHNYYMRVKVACLWKMFGRGGLNVKYHRFSKGYESGDFCEIVLNITFYIFMF